MKWRELLKTLAVQRGSVRGAGNGGCESGETLLMEETHEIGYCYEGPHDMDHSDSEQESKKGSPSGHA